jgi:hypothetical protein
VSLREGLVAALVLAACLSIACAGVVFLGRSLVYTDNVDPLDPRVPAEGHGPGFDYWPPGLTAGLAVSATSAGLVGWLAGADRRRRPPAAAGGRAEAA